MRLPGSVGELFEGGEAVNNGLIRLREQGGRLLIDVIAAALGRGTGGEEQLI